MLGWVSARLPKTAAMFVLYRPAGAKIYGRLCPKIAQDSHFAVAARQFARTEGVQSELWREKDCFECGSAGWFTDEKGVIPPGLVWLSDDLNSLTTLNDTQF